MEIVKNHNKISGKVESWEQIEDIAQELIELTNGEFKGEHPAAYAMHHSQVDDVTPLNFFTVNKKLVDMGTLPEVVVNPEILDASTRDENVIRTSEGCMSFPFRKVKKLDRFFKIKVRYQIPVNGKLKEVKEEVTGLPAQIFQHENEHAMGTNIFGMVRE